MLAGRGGATSLAEALLALSAALELDAAYGRVVKDFAQIRPPPARWWRPCGCATPRRSAPAWRSTDDGPLTFATPKVLADARVPDLTGPLTVAEPVRGRLDGAGGGRRSTGCAG